MLLSGLVPFENPFSVCHQSVALILWHQLSEGTPQHHQRSVELFYQLHNLVPSSSICEDVISQQLMHKDKVSTLGSLVLKNAAGLAVKQHKVKTEMLNKSHALS